MTGVRIQHGHQCRAEFAVKHFAAWARCVARSRDKNSRCTQRVIVESYTRIYRGRPVDSVHPGRLERMKGLGTAEMFHSSSSRKPAFARSTAHQQNMEVLRNRRGRQPHRYGNRSRSGAGGGGARVDWLCGQ